MNRLRMVYLSGGWRISKSKDRVNCCTFFYRRALRLLNVNVEMGTRGGIARICPPDADAVMVPHVVAGRNSLNFSGDPGENIRHDRYTTGSDKAGPGN